MPKMREIYPCNVSMEEVITWLLQEVIKDNAKWNRHSPFPARTHTLCMHVYMCTKLNIDVVQYALFHLKNEHYK